MRKKIVIALVVLLLGFVILVLMQPASFRVERSAVIAATPEKVFAQIEDFHKWEAWSPWAKIDPQAKVTFSGAASGKGSIFTWSGNNDLGEGRQEIIECEAPKHIRIHLEFTRPFKAVNQTDFTFVPEGAGTKVTWTMTGQNNFMGKAVSLFMDCDKMVGPDFEKGLSQLRTVCEAP